MNINLNIKAVASLILTVLSFLGALYLFIAVDWRLLVAIFLFKFSSCGLDEFISDIKGGKKNE